MVYQRSWEDLSDFTNLYLTKTGLLIEVPRVPLPAVGVTDKQGDVYRLLRGHYSSVIAPTDSCAKPVWLSPPSAFSLVRGVLAGCYQPLLPAGSSRLYSANLSPDAWSPAPTGPTECSYLFLPRCHRPSPRHYGSASRLVPRTRLSAG